MVLWEVSTSNSYPSLIDNWSKIWKILVWFYYHHGTTMTTRVPYNNPPLFIGMEVNLMDPVISMDNLKKMYAFHNVASVLLILVLLPGCSSDKTELIKRRYGGFWDSSGRVGGRHLLLPLQDSENRLFSTEEIGRKIDRMEIHTRALELLYMVVVATVYRAGQIRLQEASKYFMKLC